MKKTLNINLAGYPFTIDDDAYNLLKDYLDTIRYAFETQEDTEDLASDIESRIAEILVEKENGKFRIINKEEVSEVIERIGRPSEFIEVEETHINTEPHIENPDETIHPKSSSENHDTTPPPYDPSKYSKNPFVRKRIFRDPQGAMLGGVCAGIAAYLHIDVTVVRLLTVLLFFLSATTVAIVYIILWIVIPEAHTPLQRMQMLGEDTTVENIGKTVTGNYRSEDKENQEFDQSNRFPKFISAALSIFVKCLIIIGLIIASPLLFALALVAFCCFVALFAIGVGLYTGTMFDTVPEGQMVFYILLAVIGGAITLGIPLWLFIRMFWRKNEYSPNPSARRALLIVWVCGIALLAVFTVKAVKKEQEIDRWEHSRWKIKKEKLKKVDNMNEDDIEGVTINEKGITFQTKEGEINVVTKESATEATTEISEFKTDSVINQTERKGLIVDSVKTEKIINDTIITEP